MVASRSLFGALGSLIWAIFALFMLAWSRVLRLLFSGRPKVKLLLPLERGRVLVQVIHDAFVRSIRWERVAQSGEQLLQNLFLVISRCMDLNVMMVVCSAMVICRAKCSFHTRFCSSSSMSLPMAVPYLYRQH